MAELRGPEQGEGPSPAPEEDDGLQAVWSQDSDGHETLALAVCEAIRRKGYCIIRVADPEEMRTGTLKTSRARDFVLPRPEFEEAYLGAEAESKVAWLGGADLPTDASEDPLAFFLGRAMELTAILGPLLPEFCGFSPWEMHGGTLLRMPLAGAWEREQLWTDPLSPEDVARGEVEQHLDFVQRRRLCLLYPIESQGGDVQLRPRGDLALQPRALSLERHELLIFRHDSIGFSYRPRNANDLLLQTWIMDEPQQLQLDQFAGDQQGLEAIIGGPPMPINKQIHIMCGHCKFPGAGYEMTRAWKAWSSQTDCFIEIPSTRWDMAQYYTEEPGVPGKSVARHSAMLAFEELAAFDNEFFGMTEKEAMCLVPGYRLLLELSMEAVHKGLGLSKPQLRGRPIACVIADIGSDWSPWHGKDSITEEWLKVGATGHSVSSSARIGWTFGIQGPMHQVDTACSASLVGANILHGILRKPDKAVTEGFMMAFMNYFSPFPFVGLSGAGMLGRKGRSMTFDEGANGYARGEGAGGLVLKRSEDTKDTSDRVACYVSSFVNQDGRSASLTAPNGPSQQACIRSSMRDCQLRPEDVAITENHGTGTALGDPIEVGSIRAVFRQRGERPLPVTSGKTHMGHLEAGAGSVGLLKTITSLMHMAEPPNVHLRFLNAHIEHEGFPALFPLENVDIGHKEAVGGINSFGFGGTNSRAELWARCAAGHRRAEHWSRSAARLDCITVPCARCLGDMCWLCGVAISRSMGGRGKHHCSAIREELASYDYCSNCFGGSYKYGEALEDRAPDGGQGLYLTGTWSAWSTFEELVLADGDTYMGKIVLGETLRERFRIVMDKDPRRAIYPIAGRASPLLRVVGPDGLCQGKDWLIDGRRDGVPAGTVYRVTFEWGASGKSIRWEPVKGEAAPEGRRYEHRYFIFGSLTAWAPMEMKRHPDEPGAWEFASLVRSPNGATFAFLRDNDATQTIYPLESAPTESSVPVMGPGDGSPARDDFQHWRVQGKMGSAVSVTLRVDSGEIAVSLRTGEQPEVTWRSPADRSDRFYVVGSFTGWRFAEMLREDVASGVYRLRFAVGYKGCEQFQIVVNRNWETRLYPAHANATPGLGVVHGPGPQGDGFNWVVSGPSGQTMEISLDLASEDRCGMVTCEPCGSALDGA